jgi:heme oxygenase
MIRELLKEGTRTHHARAEASLPLMDEALTRERYVHTLARLHGFYAPLEERLARADWSAVPLAWERRRKSPLLADDLRALGWTDGQLARLPRCDRLPDVRTTARLLGCLYVLEGATLGGQLVRRHVARRLGLTPATGLAFFSAYGDAVGPMWREYQDRLAEAVARGACAPDQVVDAARDTFDAFTGWLRDEPAVAGAA